MDNLGNPESSSASYRGLKLYGVAISAVPERRFSSILNVTCTPIYMAYENRDDFTVLQDSALKLTIDTLDLDSLMDGLGRITHTIEAIVELQRKNLERHRLPYRPVTLKIGQDCMQPVDCHVLYMGLFGKRLHPGSLKNYFLLKDFNNWAEPKNRPVYQNVRDIPEIDLQSYFKSQYGKLTEPYRFKSTKALLDDLSKIKKSRARFFSRANKMGHYLKVLEQLKTLSTVCSLSWGNFSGSSGYEENGTELDNRLTNLKRRMEAGDLDARDEIHQIADADGWSTGLEMTRQCERHVFALMAPHGYHRDLSMQERLPSYGGYLDWLQSLRETFYRSYKQAFHGPHSIRVKLAIDPPRPFFTDPCANYLRDQFEIIDGIRDPDNIRDNPTWRQRIADQARSIHERFQTGFRSASRRDEPLTAFTSSLIRCET